VARLHVSLGHFFRTADKFGTAGVDPANSHHRVTVKAIAMLVETIQELAQRTADVICDLRSDSLSPLPHLLAIASFSRRQLDIPPKADIACWHFLC